MPQTCRPDQPRRRGLRALPAIPIIESPKLQDLIVDPTADQVLALPVVHFKGEELQFEGDEVVSWHGFG